MQPGDSLPEKRTERLYGIRWGNTWRREQLIDRQNKFVVLCVKQVLRLIWLPSAEFMSACPRGVGKRTLSTAWKMTLLYSSNSRTRDLMHRLHSNALFQSTEEGHSQPPRVVRMSCS